MDWSEWIQDVGKSTINSVVEAQYKQPFELQKMQLQALGPFGQLYSEGSAQGVQSAQAPQQAMLFGFPMWMVVVGGIAAIVMIEN